MKGKQERAVSCPLDMENREKQTSHLRVRVHLSVFMSGVDGQEDTRLNCYNLDLY